MKVIIFLNGEYDYDNKFMKEIVKDNENIILCADGGANYAYKYGVKPDYIVGDLDSIEKRILEHFEKENVKIEKYPREKDYTDFELILFKVKELMERAKKEISKVYVLGGLGKRIDMTLNNLNLLEEYQNLVFLSKDEEVFYSEKSLTIENKRGYEMSIILIDEKIEKLTLKGFRYEIENLTLERKKSRLVSNVVESRAAKIEFLKGKILIILRKVI